MDCTIQMIEIYRFDNLGALQYVHIATCGHNPERQTLPLSPKLRIVLDNVMNVPRCRAESIE
jgi:hypothetical protein